MRSDREEAARSLGKFYSAGFNVLRENRNFNPRVEGLFVTDCAILFVRHEQGFNDDKEKLRTILRVIK